MERLSQARERLALDAAAAWTQFLDTCAGQYDALKKAVLLLATFDCVLSLAHVAQQQGYVKPEISKLTA